MQPAKPPDADPALCPSARCEPGAIVLGIVQKEGTIAFLAERQRVDEFFSRLAHEGRAPEKRFRFADVCRKSGCQQWTGKRCGVIDRLLIENPAFTGEGKLPACVIKNECRWFSQLGKSACTICPQVITDMSAAMASFESTEGGNPISMKHVGAETSSHYLHPICKDSQ